jgi:diguanylate cyclase (GGDEF)-like protein
MGRSKLIAPTSVAVATLVAFAAIAVLMARADAGRRAQLRIATVAGALADLETAPFAADPRAGGSPAAGRRSIETEERAIADGLSAAAQPGSPPALLARDEARLAAIEPAVAQIFRIATGPGGLQGPERDFVPGLQGRLHSRSALLRADLEQIRGLDSQRAARARDEAAAGAAGALLLLLVVFMVVYVRSVRAQMDVERLGLENLRLLEATREEATRDALTGLMNRRALEAHLGRESRVLPVGDELLLALFDLDGFKQYNDSFGHAAGDALLQRLGTRLMAASTGQASTYRLGGDEFCLLGRCSVADAEEWLAAAATALTEAGDGWKVGCTYGAAWMPSEAGSSADLMRLADERMYANKADRTSPGRQLTDVLLTVIKEYHAALDEHPSDVTELATRVARTLKLPEPEVRLTRLAAAVHEVGRTAIATAMLTKTGPLDTNEWACTQRHTLIGERIVLAAPALAVTAPLVRASHERVDGQGHPDGLSGEQIPLGARIIAVCDAYEAMTSAHGCRAELDGAAIGAETAIEELRHGAGTHFDANVVDALAAALTVSPTAIPDSLPQVDLSTRGADAPVAR